MQRTLAINLRPWQRVAYAAFALLFVAVMAFAIFQPIQVLPRMSLSPGYSLRDQDGKPFNSERMRGSLVLYTFSHSDCLSPCSSTVETLAALRSELADVPTGEIPLQFVTIFVDSEQATNSGLKEQSKQLGVDSDQWHLVTGDAEQLKYVIGSGFSTYFDQDDNGNFTVDPAFVLVDGWGIVRAMYRTPSPDVAILRRDLQLVTQEAANSTGVNRYAYEAAHLFLCYPKS